MKQNNFKIIGLLFAVLTFVILSQQAYAKVEVSPTKIDEEIIFDEPKAAKTYYKSTAGVRFKNTDNSSNASFSAPTWTPNAGWDSNIKVNISCPSNKILAPAGQSNDESRCDVIFNAPNTIDPGGLYQKKYTGTITAKGKPISVILIVKWKPPQLAITSTPNFGKLKAGETKTGTLKIAELMGYKAATMIYFQINKKEINASGVNASLPEDYIGKLEAGASKDIQVNIEVPQRGLKPGNYTGVIYITYGEQNLEGAYPVPPPLFKFEIAYPKLGLSNNTFVFPDLDIPYQGSQEFAINEVDGFTPVEGIKFDITKAYNIYEDNEEEYPGGTSWITFDSVDFVPAGESKKVKVYVNVPESAAIGQYKWEGRITTTYAGSLEIFVGGTAAFPKCPEMKQKLESMASLTLVKKNANADALRRGTLTLLQESECLRGLGEVLTVALASETLINVMDSVNSHYDKGEIDKTYQQLVNSRMDVDGLDSVSVTYPEYADNVDNMKNSAKALWESYALLVVEKFEKEALDNQYTDPKLCSDNYYKISILYTKMGDAQKALSYSEKSTECQKGYKNAEDEAKGAEAEAEKLYKEANTKIFTIYNYKVVTLIFNYPNVNEQYNESISKYEDALKLYGIVNKPRDVTRVKEQLDNLKNEKEILRKAAVVYVAIIALIILFSFIRFSRASVNYNSDTLEADLSKVVTEMKH